MKNVQIYADRIARTVAEGANQHQARMRHFLHLLRGEGLDTIQPILYGFDAVRRIYWFRNDPRGEIINLPLHEVRVWPESGAR